MMPILFHVPGLGIPVYGFGLMVVLAFYFGLILATWRSRREGLDPLVMQDLAIWLLVGGLVGSRLFYVAEYWGETIDTLADVFRVWEGGIVFYGSVFGALAAFFLFRLVRRFPMLATLDALAPSVALGIALGRVGCFLNGCCYGDVCSYPWAVQFPRGSAPWMAERAQQIIGPDAPLTLPLHPTQLYCALSGLALFLLLSAYYPLRRRDGEVIGLLAILYPITRYLVERLRDDENVLVSGLTIAQVISVFLLGFSLMFWSHLQGRPARRLADEAASG